MDNVPGSRSHDLGRQVVQRQHAEYGGSLAFKGSDSKETLLPSFGWSSDLELQWELTESRLVSVLDDEVSRRSLTLDMAKIGFAVFD